MRSRRVWIGLPAAAAALALLAGPGLQAAGPGASRWSGDGHARDELREIDGRISGGVSFVPARVGRGFLFNGTDGGIAVPDAEPLRLTKNLTISAWVNVHSYPRPEQLWGMIVFRGDDHSGRDPYYVGVAPGGQVAFGVVADGGGAEIRAPIPLNRFVHVVASLDDETGLMRLCLDGEVAAQTTTDVRPIGELDPGANPGIGIGNHASRPSTFHNFPFHGILDEVTISGESPLALTDLKITRGSDGRHTGTVTLAVPAPPAGVEVTLGSTDAEVQVPARVTVLGGKTQVSFPVTAPPAARTATITATFRGVSRAAELPAKART